MRHDVDFVLIGGLARIALGSSYNTYDVDVAYARDPENLERLAAALHEIAADAEMPTRGLNFTLETRGGSLDVLGEPAGAPAYDTLRAASSEEEISGVRVRIASIDHLIAMKEAAGRPQDKLYAMELRQISDELRAPRGDAA